MSGNSSALNEQLLSQLECPVCFETCVPPIYMCSNGHHVCTKCQTQLNECSTCRVPGRPAARSIPLEKIAELVVMPCSNKTRGCKLMFNMNEMTKHLPTCDHGFDCRVCNVWKGSANDLKDHVANVHKSHLINLPSSGVMTKGTTAFKSNHSATMLCSFEKALFWIKLKYKLDERVISCPMWLVSHNSTEASEFFFTLEFPSSNSKLKVTYQGEVLNLKENARQDDTEFVIPASILDSYTNLVIFSISIMKK